MRALPSIAVLAVLLVAAPAAAQSPDVRDMAAARALSTVAIRALEPLIARDEAELLNPANLEGDPAALYSANRTAAEAGDGAAQARLGLMYSKGVGVERDLTTAHMWFTLARDQGVDSAAIYRDLVAKLMTPAELVKAQGMALERQAALQKQPVQKQPVQKEAVQKQP